MSTDAETTPPGPPRRARRRARRGEGDHTRREILDAADRLLVACRSASAVSVRAVANEVGLTPPAIYRYFPDKDHLIFEVCGRHFDRLDDDAVAPVLAEGLGPLETLRRICHAYVRFGLEDPEHYRVMFMGHAQHTPELYAEERILETGALGEVIALVQETMDAGLVRDDAGDAVMVTMVIWSALHGIVATAVAKPNMPMPPVADLVDATIDALYLGLLTDQGRDAR